MKAYILLVMCVVVSGCSVTRRMGEDYCEESKLNTDSIHATSRCILEAWPTRHGLIKRTLGPRFEELPSNTIDSMEALNELAAVDPNTLTDYQLGEAMGYLLNIAGTAVEQILRKYAPEALRYMPW